MVAKPIDAVLFRHLYLVAAGLTQAQVIESEVGRQVQLIVSWELGAFVALVHSVNPRPHHSSFSRIG